MRKLTKKELFESIIKENKLVMDIDTYNKEKDKLGKEDTVYIDDKEKSKDSVKVSNTGSIMESDDEEELKEGCDEEEK